jgi:metal-sulfur cluster biosynthetic enzyme
LGGGAVGRIFIDNNMSDPINANPTVLDESELPTRQNEKTKRLGIVEDAGLVDLKRLPTYTYSLFSQQEDVSSPPSLASDASSSSEEEAEEEDDDEPIDAQEIYDLVSSISDPEHPLTLGQLAVINLQDIQVVDNGNPGEMAEVRVFITPTITHCSLATLIGLGIRVRLDRCLPPRYRITIKVKEGTHQSEGQVNKQLNDKERVAAACENEQLLGVISNMLVTCK